MTKEEALLFLKEKRKTMNDLNSVISMVYWDMEVVAPIESIEHWGEILGYLSAQYHQLTTDTRIEEALEVLAVSIQELDQYEKRLVEIFSDLYQQNKKIPESLKRDLSMAIAVGKKYWKKAKEAGDYEIFKPHLKRIIDLLQQQAEFVGYQGHIYNALLDDYEKGMTVEVLDGVFATLKVGLLNLLEEVMNDKHPVMDPPKGPFPKEMQEELIYFMLDKMGYRFREAGRVDEVEHPFTISLGPKDVRVTTHYYEDTIESALFSSMHEGGHAIYEQNMPHEQAEYGINVAPSTGIHESQSRFYENIIGRSYSCWHAFYKDLQKIIPAYQGVSLEEFYQMVNDVVPSLIRTEADEVTYSLHIIIRYEIEKLMISGEIGVDEIPALWNEKYKEYLGVEPKNDSEGVLQDVHWADGMIGYFPSYALGNLYGAQFYHQMKKDIPDVMETVAAGDLSVVFNWLKENVHSHGNLYKPGELVEYVTGEPLNPNYYLDYLREKYLNRKPAITMRIAKG